ncbi:MAG: anhydro-N-acetylmuramic acid kinase [Candidatus Kapaibacterium sp.]
MSRSLISSYREKPLRLVAGVMSGTSLDGVDVAFVEISGAGNTLRHRLAGYQEVPYPAELKQRILAASSGEMGVRSLFELDADLGGVYADAIRSAASHAGIDVADIDAIGLHGQTVYHAPRRLPHGLSVQIGSAAIVAGRLRTIVVNDFRSADVAAGGEGAPLVPYCDFALLRSAELNRVALNIGGIANITWLPRDVDAARLIAFDTGPGNMLIDAAMRELRGMNYDRGGELAMTGTPDACWLEKLLANDYYAAAPPKSAGREQFGEDVGREMARHGKALDLADADIIATLTLLTARTIARGIRDHATGGEQVDEMIVGGGGARNITLMHMLADEMPGTAVAPADAFGLPADAKEAICFAVLANETLNEVPANVPSVTGASRPVICGAIRLP